MSVVLNRTSEKYKNISQYLIISIKIKLLQFRTLKNKYELLILVQSHPLYNMVTWYMDGNLATNTMTCNCFIIEINNVHLVHRL